MPTDLVSCERTLAQRAVLRALHDHPDWTLEKLGSVMEADGLRFEVLGALRVADLWNTQPPAHSSDARPVTRKPVPIDLEAIERTVERRSLLLTLRDHPEWTLEDLVTAVEADGHRSKLLRGLTVADLWKSHRLGPTPISVARRAMGSEFDKLVLQALQDARRPVKHAYLRVRVGGPRWKVQQSLQRLVAAGHVVQTGITSARRYEAT